MRDHGSSLGLEDLGSYLGGAGQEEAVAGSDADLVRAVREDLRMILGLESEPIETRTYRWKDANPQYNVGHAARVRRIEERLRGFLGLNLAGSSWKGVGIPDCVRAGREAARWLLAAADAAPPGAVF